MQILAAIVEAIDEPEIIGVGIGPAGPASGLLARGELPSNENHVVGVLAPQMQGVVVGVLEV